MRPGDPHGQARLPGKPELPIETPRLRLRDYVPNDWAAVYVFASNPEVARFMFWEPRTESDSREFVARMIAAQHESPRVTWELAVERISDRKVIGSCDLTLEGDEGDLGYVLAQEAWGQGFATELSKALITVGFDIMKLRRIFSTCDRENIGSRRVLEKAGLKFERELIQHKIAKGRSWDSLEYAIYPDAKETSR